MPRQFIFRGVRLAFSNGIIYLGVLACLLIILFQGSTHLLIPLYAVGVFISFTLSQAGMVRRWLTKRGPHWRKKLTVNGIGAVTTAIATVIIASTKFVHGAWIVIVLIPLLLLVLFDQAPDLARVEKAVFSQFSWRKKVIQQAV